MYTSRRLITAAESRRFNPLEAHLPQGVLFRPPVPDLECVDAEKIRRTSRVRFALPGHREAPYITLGLQIRKQSVTNHILCTPSTQTVESKNHAAPGFSC